MGAPFNPFASGGTASSPAGGGTPPTVGATVSYRGTPSDPLTPVSPPFPLLAFASGAAVAALVLGVLGWGQWFALLAWLLAGPIAIGVLAAYIHQDTGRRAAAVYVRPDWLGAAYVVVIAAVVAAISVTAIATAMWVGRL